MFPEIVIFYIVNISSSDPRFSASDKLKPFGEDLPKDALDLYPSSAPCPTLDRCPERAYTTMVSDMRVTCPSNEEASRAAGEPGTPTIIHTIQTHEESHGVKPTSVLSAMYIFISTFPQFPFIIHCELKLKCNTSVQFAASPVIYLFIFISKTE